MGTRNRVFKLTAESVARELADPTPRVVWDGEKIGLGLRVWPPRGIDRSTKKPRVRPRGVYVFRYRRKGLPDKWLTLKPGEHGNPHTADQARQWAEGHLKALRDGKDPAKHEAETAEVERAANAEDSIPTLKEYAGPDINAELPDARSCRYLHLKATRTKPDPPKPSSVKVDRGNLTRICRDHPDIAAKQLHLITKEDIERIVNRDANRSAGNRWLAVLRHMFGTAAGDSGMVCKHCQDRKTPGQCVGAVEGGFNLRQARIDADGRTWQDPCQDVHQYTEKGREPEIGDEHLSRLLEMLERHMTPSTPKELDAYRSAIQPRRAEKVEADPVVFPHDPFIAGLIKLQLLTGARGSEIRTARRAWVTSTETMSDGAIVRSGLLRIPHSKEGGGKTIFLAPDALKVIETLPAVKGNPFIFPGREPGKCLEQTGVVHWWSRRRGEVGLDRIPLGEGRFGPATLHDLRHNYAAIMIGEGMSLAEVGEMLGHKSEATTKKYASLVVKLKAARAATAAAAIMAKGGA